MDQLSKEYQKEFLKLVIGKSTHYFLLKISDRRYAAFWYQGLEIKYKENFFDEIELSCAFISTSLDEIRKYINSEELDLAKKYSFLPPPIFV